MLRLGFAVAALALAACAPEVPDSNPDRGVGFGNYTDYRNYKNAAPPPSTRVETTVIPDATRPAGGPDTTEVVLTGTNTTFATPETTRTVADVKPVPVPRRTGNGPGVVGFALATSHPVGAKMYKRGVLNGEAKAQRNCAGYSSPELAQEAFLEAGGPEKDKLKLDPDGDGYACAWDPTVFRSIAG